MTKKKAQEALKVAKAAGEVGGKFGDLFPERAEREAFLKTPEYEEIFQMRAALAKSDPVAS
jgi:hypothetical protein